MADLQQEISRRRTFAIISHPDAGKTTLTEKFLLFGGQILMAWELLMFIPCLVMYFLYLKIWHTLKGYTGDCCGAMFLLVELSVYLTACIICF